MVTIVNRNFYLLFCWDHMRHERQQACSQSPQKIYGQPRLHVSMKEQITCLLHNTSRAPPQLFLSILIQKLPAKPQDLKPSCHEWTKLYSTRINFHKAIMYQNMLCILPEMIRFTATNHGSESCKINHRDWVPWWLCSIMIFFYSKENWRIFSRSIEISSSLSIKK